MNEAKNNNNQNNPDEISLKELIGKVGEWYCYIKTQWVKIAIAGFLGGIIGFFYAWMQPITYTAKLTFVVEDGKSSSGVGGLASLAGQFGVDIGGSVGGGVLSGENILLYFKSESLAREVLLSSYDSTTNKSVADVYIEVYKLKSAWEKNKKIGKVEFPVLKSSIEYSRTQDSLLQVIIKIINSSQFKISKTDKKASFIDVIVTMENEELAKIYCDRIVNIVVERYTTIKTQRQKINVEKLQLRLDSISNLLRKKTISRASLLTSSSTMDINPLYTTGTTVAVEMTEREKEILATTYTNATQNLEMAKFALNQETPLIQIVDSSHFPLKKEKVSRLKNAILLSFVFVFVVILVLAGKKLLGLIMA